MLTRQFIRSLAALALIGGVVFVVPSLAWADTGRIKALLVRAELHEKSYEWDKAFAAYDEILCLYGDCGTGGELDRVLAEEGVTRIAGAHCYEFFAGAANFDAMMEAEPGTFFLTDFLVRHFDRLVIEGLGLDRFPQLRDDYFGNYRRVVYLAQFDDETLTGKAEAAADRLGLAFERRFTGIGGVENFFAQAIKPAPAQGVA